MIPAVISRYHKILAVVLFGSVARGDWDSVSDKDVFVMCEDGSNAEDLLRLKDKCRKAFADANISAYRVKDVRIMASIGSLFLWHLKLEGQVLLSRKRSFEREIEGLQPYAGYRGDLHTYRDILADIETSLKRNGDLTECDLSLLFTLARNTCMLLCMKAGVPKFGRKDVYVSARQLFSNSLPLREEIYEYLFTWKMWYERGVPPVVALPDTLCSTNLIVAVRTFLNYGVQRCL